MGRRYGPDELKSWWQKNWPRTYNQLEQTQSTPDLSGAAYQQDFEWFTVWIEWQRTRPPTDDVKAQMYDSRWRSFQPALPWKEEVSADFLVHLP